MYAVALAVYIAMSSLLHLLLMHDLMTNVSNSIPNSDSPKPCMCNNSFMITTPCDKSIHPSVGASRYEEFCVYKHPVCTQGRCYVAPISTNGETDPSTSLAFCLPNTATVESRLQLAQISMIGRVDTRSKLRKKRAAKNPVQ